MPLLTKSEVKSYIADFARVYDGGADLAWLSGTIEDHGVARVDDPTRDVSMAACHLPPGEGTQTGVRNIEHQGDRNSVLFL